jgi:hypothetical protein
MPISRRRRFVLFVGVWILLFLVTLGLHSLGTDSFDAQASDSKGVETFYIDTVRQVTQIRLQGIPRRTPGELLAADSQEYASFDAALRDKLHERNDAVYDCLSGTVEKSSIKTNFFEISFVVSEQDGPSTRLSTQLTGTRKALLADVIVERSTIQFTKAEESCVSTIMAAIEADIDQIPAERMSSVMCITRRTNGVRDPD